MTNLRTVEQITAALEDATAKHLAHRTKSDELAADHKAQAATIGAATEAKRNKWMNLPNLATMEDAAAKAMLSTVDNLHIEMANAKECELAERVEAVRLSRPETAERLAQLAAAFYDGAAEIAAETAAWDNKLLSLVTLVKRGAGQTKGLYVDWTGRSLYNQNGELAPIDFVNNEGTARDAMVAHMATLNDEETKRQEQVEMAAKIAEAKERAKVQELWKQERDAALGLPLTEAEQEAIKRDEELSRAQINVQHAQDVAGVGTRTARQYWAV